MCEKVLSHIRRGKIYNGELLTAQEEPRIVNKVHNEKFQETPISQRFIGSSKAVCLAGRCDIRPGGGCHSAAKAGKHGYKSMEELSESRCVHDCTSNGCPVTYHC